MDVTIINDKQEEVIKTYQIEINILSLIPFITGAEDYSYKHWKTTRCIQDLLMDSKMYQDINIEKKSIKVTKKIDDISDKLLVFGLVVREEIPLNQTLPTKFFGRITEIELVYTPKLDRFKYWLAYNNILPNNIKWSVIKELE
jgi:hypothetical protein